MEMYGSAHVDGVITLIAPAQSGALDDALLDRVCLIADLPGDTRRWLSPGEACELPISGDDKDRARIVVSLSNALTGRPIDIALTSATNRRKRLLVADMESTVIGQECLDELADFAGLGTRIAAITERAMRGELDFAAALTERVGLLSGLEESVLREVLEQRITLTAGAETLVATMRAHGAHTALVSGGFTYFATPIADRLGFDSHQANVLEIDGKRLTGRLGAPILGRAAKLATMQRMCTELGLGPADTLAVGDGANDLDMIKAAGIGVAFHAKPLVAREAGVRIDHSGLEALLFLQGYTRDEFATRDRPAEE